MLGADQSNPWLLPVLGDPPCAEPTMEMSEESVSPSLVEFSLKVAILYAEYF